MSAIFHLFPLLPREIQLQIWMFAAHSPRIVIILERDINSATRPYPMRRFCLNPIPPVLHACSMSRQVALGIYQKLPNSKYVWDYCLYINSISDVLFIEGRNTKDVRDQWNWTLEKSWFHVVHRLHWLTSRVAHIAIGLEGMAPVEWQQPKALFQLNRRTNVKRVTFVPRLDGVQLGQEAMFVLPRTIPEGMDGQGTFQHRMRECCMEEIRKDLVGPDGVELGFVSRKEQLLSWEIPEFDIMDVVGC